MTGQIMALSLVSPVIGVEKLRKLRRGFGALACGAYGNGNGNGDGVFPSFLPKQVEKIKDPFARSLAQRIQRLPVQVTLTQLCFCFHAGNPLMWGGVEKILLFCSSMQRCCVVLWCGLEWDCRDWFCLCTVMYLESWRECWKSFCKENDKFQGIICNCFLACLSREAVGQLLLYSFCKIRRECLCGQSNLRKLLTRRLY